MKAPSWCKNAVPTSKGWADPRTGEVLKVQKISQHIIEAFNGVPADVEEKFEDIVEAMADVVFEDVSEEVLLEEEVIVQPKNYTLKSMFNFDK